MKDTTTPTKVKKGTITFPEDRRLARAKLVATIALSDSKANHLIDDEAAFYKEIGSIAFEADCALHSYCLDKEIEEGEYADAYQEERLEKQI